MAWIEAELKNATLLDDFWNMLRNNTDASGNKWWIDMNGGTAKTDLYKISFSGEVFKRENGAWTKNENGSGSICITRHSIMKRWDGKFLVLAQTTGAFSLPAKDIPSGLSEVDLKKYLIGMWTKLVDYTVLYAYTRDNYSHATNDASLGGAVAVFTKAVGAGVLEFSFDTEYFNDFVYNDRDMQSPIVEIRLVDDGFNNIGSIGKLNYRRNTNWWADSVVRVSGWLDAKSMLFSIQSDNVPAFKGNSVPKIPFFFGNLMNKDNEYNDYVALFSGNQVYPSFYYETISTTDPLMPVTRVYPTKVSNGVDSVMISRSKYGARYQAHYLRWLVPPQAMPPSRVHQGNTHPRGWDNFDNHDYYSTNFHRHFRKYSDEIKTSRCYVVHPEEGVVGMIPNMVILPYLNLIEDDIMLYPVRPDCATPVAYDKFQLTRFEGNSPFAKSPTTPYRLGGVGILKEKNIEVDITTPPSPPTVPPPEPPLPPTCGESQSGGSGFGEHTWYIAEDTTIYIEYNFFGAIDNMHIYIGGSKKYSTGEKTYSEGSPIKFNYSVTDGDLTIVMNDGSSGSQWNYTLYCESNAPEGVKESATQVF